MPDNLTTPETPPTLDNQIVSPERVATPTPSKKRTKLLLIILIVVLALVGFLIYLEYGHKKSVAKTSTSTAKTTTTTKPKVAATTTTVTATANPTSLQTTGDGVTYSASVASSNGILTISQWGIKIPIADSLGIAYAYNAGATQSGGDGQNYSVALGSTIGRSSSDQFQDCDVPGSYGFIGRYAPSDTVNGSSGNSLGTAQAYFTPSSFNTQSGQAAYVHIGGYYYWYEQSQTPCGNSSLYGTTSQAVINGFKNAQ